MALRGRIGSGSSYSQSSCYRATTRGSEHKFDRALAKRFNAEDPIGDGFRWEAEAFTPGWVKVFPVYSRVRSLYRRFRGWSPDPGYIGGSLFVRRSDGLLVELGSTLEFEPCVVEGVFRDIGENAAADEIRAEIKRRSVGWWAEQGVAPPLVFDEITLVEIAEAVGAGERAALVARAKTHWVAQGITLPANTEAQWSEWFDDLDALDDLLCNRPSR